MNHEEFIEDVVNELDEIVNEEIRGIVDDINIAITCDSLEDIFANTVSALSTIDRLRTKLTKIKSKTLDCMKKT